MRPGKPFFCIQPSSPVYSEPSLGSPPVTELLFGENFLVEAEGAGYVFGRLPDDDAPAYIRADALAPEAEAASHRVARKLIEVYRAPALNAAVHIQLPLNALVRLSGARDTIRYGSGRPGTEAAELTGGGWVATQGLLPVERILPNSEDVARLLIGALYVPGGKTWLGCDGVGLIHTVLAACGVPIPRRSDAQLRHLENLGNESAVPPPSGACLIYAGESAGFLFPGGEVIAASTADMQVVHLPVGEFLARGGPARFFRPPPHTAPLETDLSGL